MTRAQRTPLTTASARCFRSCFTLERRTTPAPARAARRRRPRLRRRHSSALVQRFGAALILVGAGHARGRFRDAAAALAHARRRRAAQRVAVASSWLPRSPGEEARLPRPLADFDLVDITSSSIACRPHREATCSSSRSLFAPIVVVGQASRTPTRPREDGAFRRAFLRVDAFFLGSAFAGAARTVSGPRPLPISTSRRSGSSMFGVWLLARLPRRSSTAVRRRLALRPHSSRSADQEDLVLEDRPRRYRRGIDVVDGTRTSTADGCSRISGLALTSAPTSSSCTALASTYGPRRRRLLPHVGEPPRTAGRHRSSSSSPTQRPDLGRRRGHRMVASVSPRTPRPPSYRHTLLPDVSSTSPSTRSRSHLGARTGVRRPRRHRLKGALARGRAATSPVRHDAAGGPRNSGSPGTARTWRPTAAAASRTSRGRPRPTTAAEP